jgi:cob(I)alamin adenosyltransferase
MGLFYTGKGDKGKSLIEKSRIAKTSIVIEALGELDELNSLIGLVRAVCKNRQLKIELLNIQQTLFIIQANIAWLMYPKFKPPIFTKSKIDDLEKTIDRIEKQVKPERHFIIPGSTPESAWLDYLRAITRRVERKVLKLKTSRSVSAKQLDKNILAYLNRLSSFFFAQARLAAKLSDIKEQKPIYK